MKKAIILFFILFLLLSGLGTGGETRPFPQPALAQMEPNQPALQGGEVEKIVPAVQEKMAALPPGGMMTVIVTLRDQADLSQIPNGSRDVRLNGVIRALQAQADQSQKSLRGLLTAREAQGVASQVTPLWINNSISVSATVDMIQELAAHGDVARITPDEIMIEQAVQGPAEPNLSVINAPSLWDLGWFGQGVVVASMDSGVDLNHPDLFSSWRGGSNSWFDPYGQHPATPTDLSGHGTWTMGVAVGGDADGTTIGVAPQAQWIAVKIFNDSGASSATAIHLGFQWLLDPDGNPNTNDAPHVVNNSWTLSSPGCDLAFQPDLQALRAAGIVPVFAAGNYGPGSSSSRSPANYPEALPVGATNNSDVLYVYSSRGPSTCDGSIYPELVAPGVNVKTSDLYGFYAPQTGTSLAAPHVAGALALLLSAYPDLSAAQQEYALISTAVDLGAPGADNDFGNGRLDVMAAYQWLANGGGATATPIPPTATATSVPPTATSTAVPPTATATATNIPPTATATAAPDGLIFADGFESGDFSAWTAVIDAEGDLSVSSGAAMVGANGMAAFIDNRTSMYLRDDTPQSEPYYRVGFYFDPNSISMGSGNTHRILTARNASVDVIQLDFRFKDGNYQVRARVRRDAGWYTSTSWFNISDAAHLIELDWQAATSAGANDGYLSLWLDNTFKQTRSSIDNDTLRIEEVRLGPLNGIDRATSGTELFDDFVASGADVPVTATSVPPTATATTVLPTATATATSVPPTATVTATTVPPTATATTVLPTATATATSVPPMATVTATTVPPTATATTVLPTATATATSVPPTATVTATTVPPTATATTVLPTATATTVLPTATATATSLPPTATAAPDGLIFADGFESGDFSAWTAVIDTEGDLSVSSGAAMVGANGMVALIDNRTSMYLRDDTPQSEPYYRVGFYFDPNSISMGSGNTHRILTTRNASVDVIQLDFRFKDGNYQVRARVRRDAGWYTSTSWFNISDAAHLIELDWQAATSAGANDGYLSLWLDNTLKQTRSSIDNDTLRIEEVRLGPLNGIDRATSGTELFDDFISQRAPR